MYLYITSRPYINIASYTMFLYSKNNGHIHKLHTVNEACDYIKLPIQRR
jgi:hypothetical protein